MRNLNKPTIETLTASSPQEYLSVSRQESNDRIIRASLGEQYEAYFIAGQVQYQTKTPLEDRQKINQIVALPDPKDISENTSRELGIMEISEDKASQIIAAKLGYFYQAIAENDISAAILAIDSQTEILDSPPVVDSVVQQLSKLFRQNHHSLSQYKNELETITIWDQFAFISNSPSQKSLEQLAQFSHIETGFALQQAAQSPEAPSIYQLATSLGEYLVNTSEGTHLTSTFLRKAADLDKQGIPIGQAVGLLLQDLGYLHPRVQTRIDSLIKGCELSQNFLPEKNIDEAIVPMPENIPESILTPLLHVDNLKSLRSIINGSHEYITDQIAINIAKKAQGIYSDNYKKQKVKLTEFALQLFDLKNRSDFNNNPDLVANAIAMNIKLKK